MLCAAALSQFCQASHSHSDTASQSGAHVQYCYGKGTAHCQLNGLAEEASSTSQRHTSTDYQSGREHSFAGLYQACHFPIQNLGFLPDRHAVQAAGLPAGPYTASICRTYLGRLLTHAYFCLLCVVSKCGTSGACIFFQLQVSFLVSIVDLPPALCTSSCMRHRIWMLSPSTWASFWVMGALPCLLQCSWAVLWGYCTGYRD